jgi:hypothetical protein
MARDPCGEVHVEAWKRGTIEAASGGGGADYYVPVRMPSGGGQIGATWKCGGTSGKGLRPVSHGGGGERLPRFARNDMMVSGATPHRRLCAS